MMTSSSALFNFAIRLTFLLASYVVVAYLIRLFYANAINHFDIVSDWLGHGGHGLGMSYMALLMLGKLTNPFSNFVGVAFFALCTAVFAWRLATGRYVKAWWDWVHLGMGVSMMYMFWNTSQWIPLLTGLFCIAYVLFTLYYLKETWEDWRSPEHFRRFTAFLSNSAHVAIGIAMLVMFIAMQWPQLLGEAGCMSGMVMPSCPFGH